VTTISETDSPADAEAITAILIAYNRQFTPGTPRLPLRLVVHDDAGGVVGGALGYTAHGWCYVDILTLTEPMRGTGEGKRLLAAVEEAARARGCMGVYLFSYSFQAPDFYKRQGYSEFGRIDDLPKGFAQVWLMKLFG
jgi:GNAT superfamily N-acetyltransferase